VWLNEKELDMKNFALTLLLALGVAAVGLAPTDADAKRFGGGGSSGMQRSMPSRSATPDAAPARPAQATPAPATAGAAPAAAPKRSWMGPLAGLAAGLGLAALMGHLGMGAEFANIMMMALLAVVAFVAIRFVMGRMRGAAPTLAAPNGMQFAGNGGQFQAGSGSPGSASGSARAEPTLAAVPAAVAATASYAQPPTVPVGFDQAGFERIAKMIFIRLQAANDSADLNDLRQFTTPEMYASVKLDLQERGSAAQQTEVINVDAQVLDVASETDRQVVSVRFHGLIREDTAGPTTTFDEIWHLVKPTDGSREWAIAGIQQSQVNV
jgi:predicted lipid-binding transport protein (Tim44 family)